MSIVFLTPHLLFKSCCGPQSGNFGDSWSTVYYKVVVTLIHARLTNTEVAREVLVNSELIPTPTQPQPEPVVNLLLVSIRMTSALKTSSNLEQTPTRANAKPCAK